MKCDHKWRESYQSFKNNKHISTTYICNTCQQFTEHVGSGRETDGIHRDDRDVRLDKVVRQGKIEGKPLNKLRSHYVKGIGWSYKYI